MIRNSQFTDIQGSILWCQSANNGTTIGDWFFPNGTKVSSDDIDPSDPRLHPLHTHHVEGQVGLLRDGGLGLVPGLEGLYKCVIPDESKVNQTLWVAVYRDVSFGSSKLKQFRYMFRRF